jgi:hypothetical protein
MRLDEITIDGAPSHVHRIIKDAFLKAVRDVRVGEAFTPFHKHVKVKAQDNMVTVSFKTPSPHAPRSMRFAGGGKTEDELDFESLQQAAKDVAEEMVFILGQEMNIEDRAIEAHNNSVTLFMVSDGFMGESVREAKGSDMDIARDAAINQLVDAMEVELRAVARSRPNVDDKTLLGMARYILRGVESEVEGRFKNKVDQVSVDLDNGKR